MSKGEQRMDFYEKNGIISYINAHDTYTMYGGSRMAENTLQAMKEAAASFVDLKQMQIQFGKKAAELTGNEAAYFTNGAEGALLLCACICIAEDSEYYYRKLPEIVGTKREFIVMRAQRNAYDAALAVSGADIVEIGDADETLEMELEGSINEKTAGVVYFASTLYQRGSLPLETVIAIAKKYNVPVIVDAAAQLPPKENLKRFTQAGADMVIFSGGKTLCGPQDSGVIFGTRQWIERCIRFGAPEHGICRVSKTSREAMAGLYIALENYVLQDEEKRDGELREILRRISERVAKIEKEITLKIIERGPVGQKYPRLFCYLSEKNSSEKIVSFLKKERIYIGEDRINNAVYISPLNLYKEEADIVAEVLCKALEAE